MRSTLRAVGVALVTGAAGLLLALPAAATAGGNIVPGAECSTVGATGRHGGERYRCEQKPGDDCPVWHWVYNPDTPRGNWSPRPGGPCDCPPSPSHSTSPSPSARPSTSTSRSPAPATTATTVRTPTANGTPVPIDGELPVTGGAATTLAGSGLLLILAGAVGRYVVRLRRTN